jgi:hypothetical protein
MNSVSFQFIHYRLGIRRRSRRRALIYIIICKGLLLFLTPSTILMNVFALRQRYLKIIPFLFHVETNDINETAVIDILVRAPRCIK